MESFIEVLVAGVKKFSAEIIAALLLTLLLWLFPSLRSMFRKGNVDEARKDNTSPQNEAQRQKEIEEQYHLGWKCYNNGDYKQALEHFKRAAEQGNADAQEKLSDMYENGQGGMQNDKQSFYWRLKAAGQGSISAQNNLAHMYMSGNGVGQNYKAAYMWLYLANLCETRSNSKRSNTSGNLFDNLVSGMMEYRSAKLKELEEGGWLSSAKVSKSEVIEAKAEAERKFCEIQDRKHGMRK